MYNIVILSSSGGGHFEEVVKNQKKYGYFVQKLIVDRECGAIYKAEKYNIECCRVDKEHMSQSLLDNVPQNTDLIMLLGWLTILESTFINKYKKKIVNVHPSLLPKYGGKGMYGVHVHEAVMNNNEMYTGCTVHYVTEDVDCGEIILQKKIKVDYSKTPWELGGQVFELENEAVIESINLIRRQEMIGE